LNKPAFSVGGYGVFVRGGVTEQGREGALVSVEGPQFATERPLRPSICALLDVAHGCTRTASSREGYGGARALVDAVARTAAVA